jgi:hypothetical protein
MADRVVVLRKGKPLAFVADACMALADAVNQTRAWSQSDQQLIDAYAEMVIAYGRLVRPRFADGTDSGTRLAIVDHLVERIRQAQAGEFPTPVLDVVDRLHGELSSEAAFA